MIVSVFGRRLKPGATFGDCAREREVGEGLGVPTRVFNAQSVTKSRDIISISFVAVDAGAARSPGARRCEDDGAGGHHNGMSSAPLRRLQCPHKSWMLLTVFVPPRDQGILWS
jgi:hypothetical protein